MTRARRRIVCLTGAFALAALTIAFASGCIFDQSNYQGGGRRSGTPTAADSVTGEPTTSGTSRSSPTTTATGTTPKDSGVPDTGEPDA